MKRMVTTVALALATSALTVFAAPEASSTAQPTSSGEGQRGHHMKPPIIAALDANSDRVIDAQEIANSPEALKKLDKNGDGKLTIDELRPPRPDKAEGDRPNRHAGGKEGKGGKHVPPLVAAVDSNSDGVIDSNEIANAPESLKKLDKDGNGKLTVDEVRPEHPPGEKRQGKGAEAPVQQ